MTHRADLVGHLGRAFEDPALLDQAVTHRSAEGPNNERLEFLGDSILNFVIAAEVFERRPELHEGELSRLRAALVNKNALAAIARGIDLGAHIVLGSGELKTGGSRRDSILADGLEAVIGAVYLDGGYEAGRQVILQLFEAHLSRLPDMEALKDPKTRLQEYLQARHLELPTYQVDAVSGRAHQQTFRVGCHCEPLQLTGEGTAGNRRQAEQAAADDLLAKIAAADTGKNND
ncbi:ribonuclease III [Spiribacter aquaticus]|jgi:ribonuclease-3|uniref:Ribonuclease 3 n=1 Tax=Spiribacter aquaticus TaxID=1935996 RepID=A0A557RHS5_9GAMM|nr:MULTISPECIES: ribonuclease III [Spiribacter]KAF0280532.1 ribonuclease III [Spiribacter roseus]PZA00396.1 ribonuclease III [Gammaproteobacteria bacterium 2W06]TVO64717.1 ribonuclease III [Spiribacter aquaticus]